MNTGKEYTKKVKEMLDEASRTNRNVYLTPTISGSNPLRIIRVRTCQGFTVAKSINGAELPVSSLNIDRFYIQ